MVGNEASVPRLSCGIVFDVFGSAELLGKTILCCGLNRAQSVAFSLNEHCQLSDNFIFVRDRKRAILSCVCFHSWTKNDTMDKCEAVGIEKESG